MVYNTPWSDDEKKIIREHYPNLPCDRLLEAFPGRTAGSLMDMAHRLGVKKSEERLKEMARESVGKRWAAYKKRSAG